MTKRERERETKTFRPYLYLSTLALATWMVGTPPVHAAAVTHTSSVEQASAVLQGQQQQKQVIKGTVRNEKGEPLIGVSIMIKSLKKGVTTDLDGNFSIPTDNLQFPEVLQFFYVGYKSREVRVTKPGTLDITLAEDVSELNEVVVTGFIAKQKNSYTGSQATVKREELLSVGTKNVFESIAAFVPGMEIVQNNNMGSDPNTRPDINIRGRASFEGSANMPVFVVDGGIVDVDYVYDMDMNDIETVTVLKDAAASALYGAKASAGVIVITTRSLQGGKLRFNYSGTVLYVSHDRYFINSTASRILELVNQTFVNYIGNYDYYLEKKEELTRAYAAGSGSISGSAGQTAGAPSISTAPDTSASAAAVQPGSKLSWQEQKEQQAKERKRKNDLKKTEEEISRLEDRNAQIDHEMTLEEVYSNSVKCQELAEEHAANEKRLEELYEMWETLAE